jgi:lysine biosynthesis protein LysW
MVRGQCPSCRAAVVFEDIPKVDQRIVCAGCGDVLKVVSVSPIELEWAYEDLLEGPEYSVRSCLHRGHRFYQ